jgi:hypothetical protein
MAQRPIAIGLFLCEQVIIEAGTGNVTPVNCFNQRSARTFPTDKLPFVVFAELTDGVGQMLVETTIQRLDTLDEVFRFSHSVTFENQLQVIRYVARTRFSFPIAGHYQVQLFVDRESIAQRKIRLLEQVS